VTRAELIREVQHRCAGRPVTATQVQQMYDELLDSMPQPKMPPHAAQAIVEEVVRRLTGEKMRT
jgi:hypothetical protein